MSATRPVEGGTGIGPPGVAAAPAARPPRARWSRRRTGRLALGLLGPVLALAAWEAYVRLAGVDPLLLPGPVAVARALVADRVLLFDNLLVTVTEIVVGLAVALAVGAVLALAMHAWRPLRSLLEPSLIATQAVPLPVLAPVLVFWLGFDLGPKLAIVAIICFFPVVVGTLEGLDRVDPELPKVLRTLGAGRRQRLLWVEIPAAVPAALSGAKVAVAIGGIAAVFAEYAGSEAGLGHVILQAQPALATDRAFAAVALIAAFAVLTTLALGAAARALAPWAYTDHAGERT